MTGNKDAFATTLSHIKQTFDRATTETAIKHIHEWEKLPEDFKVLSQSYLPELIVLKLTPRDSADFLVATASQKDNPNVAVANQKTPICYISEYGKKYHAKNECLAVTRGKLVPAFDLNHIRKKTEGPCETCWKNKKLF